MKIIGGTGHRPPKIGGYIIPNPTYCYICQQTEKILLEEKPDKIISGMALGFDMWFANIAIKLGIPFIAALPFIGQELLWPKESQISYRNLLAKADQIEIVSPGGYASWKMYARNQYIVNNSNNLIAVLSSKATNGGTYNCVVYAKENNKQIQIIDPELFIKN